MLTTAMKCLITNTLGVSRATISIVVVTETDHWWGTNSTSVN